MIYILTGEDIVSSRNKLNELITSVKNVVKLDGKKIQFSELELKLSSNNLFEEVRTIVVESFLKLKPHEVLVKQIQRFEQDKLVTIILWDEQDLPVKLKNVFKSAKSFSFVFPKVYYAFLDGLEPGSQRSSQLLSDVLKTFEPEQVLYGVIKRLRQLMVLKSENYNEFEEFAKKQDWQLGKLRTQALKWPEITLKNKFLQLSELDEKLKTSSLPLELSRHLDIMLISDLN